MISRWSAKTLKSTQMYRTVMESFRNSSKARFFQPGFSSCIMVTVLVGEEGLLAAKSQAISQENHKRWVAARLEGATFRCWEYTVQGSKKLRQTRGARLQKRSLRKSCPRVKI